jgi:hypothetical protein
MNHHREYVLQRLRAISMVRDLHWSWTTEDPTRRQLVDESLGELSGKIENVLKETDIQFTEKDKYYIDSHRLIVGEVLTKEKLAAINRKRKRSANDKVNRLIFTIHEHVVRESGSPQWNLLLDLFKAAGAIQVGAYDSPDRRIKPHLKHFEENHPKEASFIRQKIVPDAASFKIHFPS